MCLMPHRMVLDSTGKYVFSNKPSDEGEIYVPCGKCLECLKDVSEEWSWRIMDEAKLYEENCVITLTYNDDALNGEKSLNKRDYQLFLKRLRKYIKVTENKEIRYFLSAEYGSKLKRPHYHIIIFGWIPKDLKYWTYTKKRSIQYRSKVVETLWIKGFSTIGLLDKSTAKYTAKYLQKLNYEMYEHDGLLKPFVKMSTHPGIGYGAIKFADFTNDKIYQNGFYKCIPRYYLKVAEREGIDLIQLKLNRLRKAERCQPSMDKIISKRENAHKFLTQPK